MAKILDLYLKDEYDKDLLLERKTRLERAIESLESQRQQLEVKLAADCVTDEQIENLQDFAYQAQEGLIIANEDFEARRAMIEYLDLNVTLAIEDSLRVIYLTCIVGEDKLTLGNTTLITID